jgi:hypothetical protein
MATANNQIPNGLPPALAAVAQQASVLASSATAGSHFGGSLNPSGKLGPKPAQGKPQNTFRSAKRLELIARLENAAVPESAAAAMLCISVNRLRQIKKSPEYLRVRMRITLGIITDTDGSLADIKAQRREALTRLLPPALQVIANAVQAPAVSLAERKFQHEVVTDLLDREGSFPKVSRQEVSAKTGFDWGGAEAASQLVLQVLQVAAPGAQNNVNEILGVASSFSAGATLSPEEQQDALASLDENSNQHHD